MKKIRKGDQIVVLSGRDKGRTRRRWRRCMADGTLVIDGINVVKKHAKGNPQKNQPGGILEQGDADGRLEGGDLEWRREEGRPRRHQDARRRQARALPQVEQRSA
jgi:hypothetical protein